MDQSGAGSNGNEGRISQILEMQPQQRMQFDIILMETVFFLGGKR